MFVGRGGGGKIVGIGTHGGSSAKHNTPPSPFHAKTCRPEISAGCKTSRRLSLNPATSTRGARKRRGGSFLFCRNYFSRKSFLSHFSPLPLPPPPPLLPPLFRSRGFRRLRETCSIPGREYDTTGARLVSETLRGRAQECFLPSASCRLSSSLSLSLLVLLRTRARWMLASFFFFFFSPSSFSYFECEPLTREIRGNRAAENACVRLRGAQS